MFSWFCWALRYIHRRGRRFITFWPFNFMNAWVWGSHVLRIWGLYFLDCRFLSLTVKRSVGLTVHNLVENLQLHRSLRCDSHVFRAYDSQILPLKSLQTFSRGICTPSLWATFGLPPNFGQPPACPSIHVFLYEYVLSSVESLGKITVNACERKI